MSDGTANKLTAAALKKAYLHDLAEAWAHFRVKHPDHTPYAFWLHGSEDPIRLHLQVLTLQGLQQVAAEYQTGGYYETLDEAVHDLRYSVADSPLFAELENHIPTVDALIAPHEAALRNDGTYAPLANPAIAAFKELDAQGIFGTGEERDRLVLAIDNDFTRR